MFEVPLMKTLLASAAAALLLLAGCSHRQLADNETMDFARRPAAENAPEVAASCVESSWDGDHWLRFLVNGKKHKLVYSNHFEGRAFCEHQRARLTSRTAVFPLLICSCDSNRFLHRRVGLKCVEVQTDGKVVEKIEYLRFADEQDGGFTACVKEAERLQSK